MNAPLPLIDLKNLTYQMRKAKEETVCGHCTVGRMPE